MIFLLTKHSGIDPCEKRINIPGGHAWRHVFMACSKLEAMAICLVKQACGNDKLACVYSNNSKRNLDNFYSRGCSTTQANPVNFRIGHN